MFNKSKEPEKKKDIRDEPVEVQVKESITYHYNHQPKQQETFMSPKQFFKMMQDVHDQKEKDLKDGIILGGKPTPHARLVLLKDKDESIEDVLQFSRSQPRDQEKEEPAVVLVSKDDKALGKVNLHDYLEYVGFEKLVELVDSGQLSVTCAKLPEAVFNRIEDGDERGTNAFAGILATQGDDPELLSVHYFTQVDDLIYYDVADDAEREAIISEQLEERADRALAEEPEPEDRSQRDDRDDYDPYYDPVYDDPNMEHGDDMAGMY